MEVLETTKITMKKKEDKICKRCKLIIRDDSDFFRITAFRKGDFDNESYYHVNCFHEEIGSMANKRIKESIPQAIEIVKNSLGVM